MQNTRATASDPWDLDNRTFYVGLIVLALGLAFVHWDWLVLGKPIYGNDSSLFYPISRDMMRWAVDGYFPQWSERYLCGQPVAAEANFFLYHPLRLLLLRFGGVRADGIWYWLHALLAAGGMAAYARTLGLSRAASLLAACSYPLSGYFTGHIIHPNTFAVGAWVPLQLCCVERILSRPGPLNAALLAIACALQWLSGQPQIAMLTNYVLAFYCLLRTVVFPTSAMASARGPLGATAYAQLLGAVLAAVQFLPMRDVLAESGRLSNLPYEFAAAAPLPPWGLLLPLFPAIYGTEGPSDGPVFWLSSTSTWNVRSLGSWEFEFYPGAVVTMLALYASLRCWKDPRYRAHLTVLVVCLLFALGTWTPVHWLLWHLPGISAGRVPTRSMLFATTSLIVMAGLAFDDIATGRRLRRTSWVRVSTAAVACMLAVWFAAGIAVRVTDATMNDVFQARFRGPVERGWTLGLDSSPDLRRYHLDMAARRSEETVEQIRLATNPWSFATGTNLALAIAGGLIVMAWIRAPASSASGWMFGVIAILCVDLLWFSQTFGGRAADDPHPHDPPAYAGRLDRSQRVLSLINPDEARTGSWSTYRAALPSHLTAAWKLDTPDGNTGLAPQQFLRDVVYPFTNPLVPGAERLRRAVGSEDLLRLLGIGTVISGSDWGKTPWPLLYEGEGVRVWQIPSPLARAFTAADSQLPDIRWQSPHAQPASRAVAERAVSALLQSAQSIVPVAGQEIPDEIEYEVTSAGKTILVRTTRMFPGWHASIDGEEAAIYPALGFFQGVAVPPGTHRVRFEFRPDALRYGLLMTGFGCFLLLSLLFTATRQGRSQPKENLTPLPPGEDSGEGIEMSSDVVSARR